MSLLTAVAGKLLKIKIIAYKKSTFSIADVIPEATFIGGFNPSEYTLTRSNNFSEQNTQGTMRPQSCYTSGNNDKLNISFMFDGTGEEGLAAAASSAGLSTVASAVGTASVMLQVKQFLGLLQYRGDIHKPPYVEVMWGLFTFQGVLKSATAKFVMFDKFGCPIRAKIDAEFQQIVNESTRLAEEQTSSPDVNRVWPVREGDRIDQIAYQSYGDARYWRQLANANHLDNPRRLRPGQVLVLPRLVS